MTGTRTILITDSGFGGISVLAQVYESLKHERFPFPLNLFFVEALPKNCPGYPWQGYSLMPDRQIKVKVFNNFLNGAMTHFQPELIAVVCNTLSALAQETDFFSRFPQKALDIMEAGFETLGTLKIEEDARMIILGTETTISSDIHRRWLLENAVFPNERIIPLAFEAGAHYPLRIETEPHSAETFSVTEQTLSKAIAKMPDRNVPVYVYLGCTHFGFVEYQYRQILNKAGYERVNIINPNSAMTRKVLSFIRNLSDSNPGNRTYPPQVRVYSQFALTDAQINSGSALVAEISAPVADALRGYIFKNDITEPWKA
jgi:glutamate racemase